MNDFGMPYNEQYLFDSAYEQETTDIKLSPFANIFLLAAWIFISLIGFAVMFMGKKVLLGVAIIGLPTFVGMVLKPSFALSVFMLVLPTGGGIGYNQMFSLDRGVGIALALSFLLNISFSRPRLNLRRKAIWIFIVYTIWIFLVSLTGSYFKQEMIRFLTQFQLLVLTLITYWILTTNNFQAFKWCLRSYITGTIGMFLLTFLTGAAAQSQMEGPQGRYAATLGSGIDANALGIIYALAFLAAAYLMLVDKSVIWRSFYIFTFIAITIALFLIGSRTALLALGLSIFSPLIFLSQTLRKPKILFALITLGILGFIVVSMMLARNVLESGVQQRLTDVSYAEESLGYRMHLNKVAMSAVLSRPLGVTFYDWFDVTGVEHWPHNDFFLALGVYGVPGALLLVLFWLTVARHIHRIPFSMEKMFARCVLIFLLLSGLTIGQLFHKHYWVFMVIILAIDKFAGESDKVAGERNLDGY